MYVRTYVYLQTQYKRHGVKSEADKKASTAAVKGQLMKVLNGGILSGKDNTSEKASGAKPYGSNPKGTNSNYFVKDQRFDLDPNAPEFEANREKWEQFCILATNIATRLEAMQQYDISVLKQKYKDAKDTLYQDILGSNVSRSLSVDEKRALDSKLSGFTFSYYESRIMIVVISNEVIDALAHCKQNSTTESGEYVYHICSKTIITRTLLTPDQIAALGKEETDYVKLLSQKTANKYKTVLYRLIDQYGNVSGYRREMSAIDV